MDWHSISANAFVLFKICVQYSVFILCISLRTLFVDIFIVIPRGHRLGS